MERDSDKKKEKYISLNELADHNCLDDCWLSWLGDVYDITPILQRHKGDPLLVPILMNAGSDISDWFDNETGDPRLCVSPTTNLTTYHTPHGRFLHIPPDAPRSDFDIDSISKPWWQEARENYKVGRLCKRTRKLRILNALTGEEVVIEVCPPEPLNAIQDRYTRLHNSHAKSYTWKRLGQVLDMSATLDENGVRDDGERMDECGFVEQLEDVPGVILYFTDDLTVA
ncbi:cytochrome b5 domain-containing protein 1-like protein [Gonapodya prolifera JEL478]|uniref:Cytochrome b5 domain-containing protein 1 n=1 Tax=Gonapodya prolifera (strain JEL478) TaxID=1344416 RepID=A0A139AU53_GONPJ|nr:cytochrome b5 domain-containing protein 1-like protein [Gonapodya prolifera JEL478]|eukprot:KXS20025.1 cytochrome b5 domain-containing protein 1-like protein [Gonapodya prolifera JEL478]